MISAEFGRRLRAAAAAGFALLFLMCAGCGKKDMPRPPHTQPPPPVCGLSVEKQDGKARLTWNQAGCRPGGKVEGFLVYVHREKADKPSCTDCPMTYEKAATVHIGRPNLWRTTPDKAVHIETIQPGRRYIFKVTAFGPGGESADSEPVVVE